MTVPRTVESKVDFKRYKHGRKQLCTIMDRPQEAAGRLPRITRLMALAIRFDGLLRAGLVSDQAQLARLGHVSRARMTQIMNLLYLAPDIQEDILFLPAVRGGRDHVRLAQLQPITQQWNWQKQRQLWQALLARAGQFQELSGNCLEVSAGTR
jgi:hypothetical protein